MKNMCVESHAESILGDSVLGFLEGPFGNQILALPSSTVLNFDPCTVSTILAHNGAFPPCHARPHPTHGPQVTGHSPPAQGVKDGQSPNYFLPQWLRLHRAALCEVIRGSYPLIWGPNPRSPTPMEPPPPVSMELVLQLSTTRLLGLHPAPPPLPSMALNGLCPCSFICKTESRVVSTCLVMARIHRSP